MPVRIPKMRTPQNTWESQKDSYVPINPLSCSPLQGVSARNSFPAAFGRNALARVCSWTKQEARPQNDG